MLGGPIRLREHRAVQAKRRSGLWRLPVMGGALALVVGAACWAPLAPAAWAPGMPVDEPAVTAAVASQPVVVVAGLPLPAVVPALPTATPAPTLVPTPVVVPTLTATGRAVLDGIRFDRTAQWVKNHTETALRSGPTEDSLIFTRLPQWSVLKQFDSKPDWLLVQYSGDGDTRQAGPGWVKASDVGGIDAPPVWLRAARGASLWTTSDASAKRRLDVPATTLMEVIGSDSIQGTRVHVRLPGDGRGVPPSEGWVDGDTIGRAAAPSVRDLPWAYPADLHADVRINVPYRTQLDGSDFAAANCGPTVLGMALESFGVNIKPTDLRGRVLNTENFDPNDDDAGSFIWALSDVVQNLGLKSHGLYEVDGALHRWTTDEIRASLRQGQPVIVQVRYRALPGREDSNYFEDHYVILTGLLGDSFLYNDPIGGTEAHESPGYDRLMTSAQLGRAMHASDTPYAYTAFGVSR